MEKLGETQSVYMPDADTVLGPCFCGVCKTEMIMKRGCYGPRSFSSAMGGFKSYYDSFTCPDRDKNWHRQVVAIRDEARDTSSKKLERMLLKEAKEILAKKKATKKVSALKGY